MAKASPALTSFAAGELSPDMEGRIDVDKYAVGAHIMENFQCLIQGPAQKRSGTIYVATAKTVNNFLRRFIFSQTQAYQIEFGVGYCRFFTSGLPVTVSGVAAWSNVVNYVIGDLVLSGGVNYYCVAAHINHVPPNSTYWYALTGSIYEIPSPYSSTTQLGTSRFGLSFEQSADVLYIGCNNGDVPAYTLTRYGNTNWQFKQFAPTDGPFLEMNQNTGYTDNFGVAMYVSGINGNITINAIGGNVFSSTDVGRLVRIQVQTFDIKPWTSGEALAAGTLRRFNGNTYKALNAATTGLSPPTNITGTQWDGATNVNWQYMDSGYGTAVITAYTSATQVSATVILQFPTALVGTTATITAISQANPAVVTVVNAFAVGDPVFISGVAGMAQINNKPYTLSAVTGANVTLSSINSTNFTAYSSGGTIVRGASVYWQMGAWASPSSVVPGYWPTCVAFFDERLFWAGGIRWVGSVPADYASYAGDFNGQVTTDCSVSGVLAAQDVNSILWMSQAQVLLMGTAGGEFGLSAITTTNPLGPDNIHVVRQSKNGVINIAPELVGTSLLYVNKSGRKVLAMDYNFYNDRYDSTNQNRLAYHITKGGIIGSAWQSQPYETLWGPRSDGQLLGYTFDREDQVTGWHRHVMGGVNKNADGSLTGDDVKVVSVSVIPGNTPNSTPDQTWLIVQRNINGAQVNFIEYVDRPYESGSFVGEGEDGQPYAYTDASYLYYNVLIGKSSITALSYLEGQTVSIVADGKILGQKVVTGGTVSLGATYHHICIGLPYTATLTTMRIEAGADVGTSQAKTKRIPQGALRLKNTIGGQYGMNGFPLRDIFENDQGSIVLDAPVEPFSGDKVGLIWPGEYETDCQVTIVHSDPTPCTVVAIFPNLQTNEPT